MAFEDIGESRAHPHRRHRNRGLDLARRVALWLVAYINHHIRPVVKEILT